MELRRRVLGPEHPETLVSMQFLASVYHDEGDNAKAEAVFAETDRHFLDRAPGWIVTLYQSWGKPAKAAAWQKS